MRKLKLQLQMSIDGFVGGPNGEMDWLAMPWTDDINTYVGGIVENIDTIVLGRKLAEGFIPYWASVAADPANPEVESGKLFTNTPKVVFSRTIQNHEWPNTVVANGELVAEITELKNQQGEDIYACGGATFATALLANQLVDELYLFINPSAIGAGLSIFGNTSNKQDYSLVDSQPFQCGIVVLHYQPKRS